MSSTNGSGKWAANNLTFDTKEEAEAYAYALDQQFRWIAVREFRTVEIVPDPDFLDRIIKD